MTTDFRALCTELSGLDGHCVVDCTEEWADAMCRLRAALAEPVAEGADLHYAWEVHDAAGDWQAGGSANSLEDVQREGNRYLQTYSQDGPHKLIIQRHCVSTIEEVTNAQ